MATKLILCREPSGFRHYVATKAVHCGWALEMEIAPGVWVLVRYEWDNNPQHRVMLFAPGGKILPDDNARFRWPE